MQGIPYESTTKPRTPIAGDAARALGFGQGLKRPVKLADINGRLESKPSRETIERISSNGSNEGTSS